MTATDSLLTVHFPWFLTLPGSAAAHGPLLKCKSILGRSVSFCIIQRAESYHPTLSYIQNRAALPFKKRGVGEA